MLVNALIFKADKILLCQKKNRDHRLILPGGKMETGETETEALTRELIEELRIKNLAIIPDSRKVFHNLKTLQECDLIHTLVTYKVFCSNSFLRDHEIKQIFLYSKEELRKKEIPLSSATKIVLNSLRKFSYY